MNNRMRLLPPMLAMVPALIAAPSATAATGCPNDATRLQQGATDLPECRAYEQVSPVDKNSYPVYAPWDGAATSTITAAAPDGRRVVFQSWGSFAGSTHGMATSYLATRQDGGWSTVPTTPAPTVPNPEDAFGDGVVNWKTASADLTRGVIWTDNWWDPADLNGVGGHDLYVSRPDGTVALSSRAEGADGLASGLVPNTYGSVSPDGEHVVFESPAHLAPEDALRPDGVSDLYEREGDDTRVVAIGPGGGLAGDCGSTLASPAGTGMPIGATSDDGSRIFFYTGAAGCTPGTRQLFVRIDGERTVQVSATRRSTADPAGPQDANFLAATPDGSRVFFDSKEMLTDDAPDSVEHSYLYEYRTDTDELRVVMAGGDVANVVGVSVDGEQVYFASSRQIDGQGQSDAANLYRLVDGETTLLGAGPRPGFGWLTPRSAPFLPNNGAGFLPAADGKSFAFITNVSFDGADPNDRFQVFEVYVYTEAGGLRCASCAPPGRPSLGTASLPLGDGELSFNGGPHGPGRFAHGISADGSHVLFDTTTALVADDTNNRRDAYLWHDGAVSLLSSGKGRTSSYAMGLSRDGRDAFFMTGDALAPQDTDGGDYDVYDARVDGGFPVAVETPPVPCAGDDCQGARTLPPDLAGPGSIAFAGPGNRPRTASGAPGVPRRKTIRGSTGRLRVRVPGPGTISVSGSAVERTRRSASRAASYTVRVALDGRARRTLERRRTLRTPARVTFAPRSGRAASRTVSLTFKHRGSER